jgi:capsular polysaccharide biosynthesis protein
VDLWDLTKLLFRRWLISVPILLLSVVLLLVASQTVKPDYKATGHLIIVSPAQTTQALNNAAPTKVHNPWEDLGFRALAQTAILKVQSADMLKQLVEQGYSDNLTLAVDDRTPVITIEVVAHSSTMATATIREVIKNLDDAVTQAQTVYGVQRDSLFTAYPIDQGDSVETVTSTQKRAMAVIAGIGLVATVAITILIDALLRRRASRRAAAKAAAADSSELPVALPSQRNGDLGAAGSAGVAIAPPRKPAKKPDADEALTVTLNALGTRRPGDTHSTGGDAERRGNGNTGANRVLTVDYKQHEDAGNAAKAKGDKAETVVQPRARAHGDEMDEAAVDSTVVLPLTSLWGGQDPKRRRR